MIITIAGPPCSGKTTLARALADRAGPATCMAPDTFAAFCARLDRAPNFKETLDLWDAQVCLNYQLAALFDVVFCAGSPWAINAYARARGTHPHWADDAGRLRHYGCGIILYPLPWMSAPGRAEEHSIDRVAMANDMVNSIESFDLPHIVIRTPDHAERLAEALEWLESWGVLKRT